MSLSEQNLKAIGQAGFVHMNGNDLREDVVERCMNQARAEGEDAGVQKAERLADAAITDLEAKLLAALLLLPDDTTTGALRRKRDQLLEQRRALEERAFGAESEIRRRDALRELGNTLAGMPPISTERYRPALADIPDEDIVLPVMPVRPSLREQLAQTEEGRLYVAALDAYEADTKAAALYECRTFGVAGPLKFTRPAGDTEVSDRSVLVAIEREAEQISGLHPELGFSGLAQLVGRLAGQVAPR